MLGEPVRRIPLLLIPALLAAGTAEFRGRKVHFTSQGTGPTAVVLIHGWTCDGGFWSANVPALAARHRVLVVDLPGHGRSDACAACSMEEFGDAVLAVMDAAGVRQAVMVGHSMGGPVMLACARRAPERVQAIVAVDAVFLDASSAARLQGHGDRFAGPGGLAAREKLVRSMFTPTTPKPVQEQVLKSMLGAPETVAVGAMNALVLASFWKDDQVRLPFLEIAAGSRTGMTEEGLRKRFPAAQLKRIEGTGHFLMMEQPEAFNRMVLNWLDHLPK